MTSHPDLSPPSDVCLLLRAHAQQHWLNREVMPVLHELEDREAVPEDQVAAALAYLEVLWLEASIRASETDAAFARLDTSEGVGDEGLHEKVRRYHAAVHALHEAVGRHVSELVSAPASLRDEFPANW